MGPEEQRQKLNAQFGRIVTIAANEILNKDGVISIEKYESRLLSFYEDYVPVAASSKVRRYTLPEMIRHYTARVTEQILILHSKLDEPSLADAYSYQIWFLEAIEPILNKYRN